MRVVALDSSSTCTGVVVADIKRNKIVKIGSCPIIPEKFDISSLGYRKTKKKMKSEDGTEYSSYIKPEESHVSAIEAKKRNVHVRHEKNSHKMKNIGAQLDNIIKYLKPDLIVIEKNKTFNSILTTALLAEVMGLVEGVASANGIAIKKYTVEQVRKNINCAKITSEFAKTRTPAELSNMSDVTKESIKDYMMQLYQGKGFEPGTLDESDACLVFHYWFENEYNK